jgi:uncharacterized membrane protein YdjX (TVP38/TMEM64 family)
MAAAANAHDEGGGVQKDRRFSNQTMMMICVAVLSMLGAICKHLLGNRSIVQAMEQAATFVEAQGETAVLWYCAFTTIGVVCLVPTTPMEVAGGFLLSPKYGTLNVLIVTGFAKLVASVISVLLARYVLRDFAMALVEKSEWLCLVRDAIQDEPFKMTMLVRGSMAPISVKNYGLGVMDVPFIYIIFGSIIFSNFYAAQNIYVGASCQNLAEAFAPKKGVKLNDPMAPVRKLAPMLFNLLLVFFLAKAIKSAMNKQQAKLLEARRAQVASGQSEGKKTS